MKIFHLADLHIGKSVNGFSLIEDQKYILLQILEYIDAERPDTVCIAGDIYDKTVPSGAAVSLLDDFLTALTERNVIVFCISGNHDSPERLAFANRIMQNKGIYISGVFDGKIKTVPVRDSFGTVHVHLLPFVKPANVRPFYPEASIESYTDALQTVLLHNPIDRKERNVLVAHQFVLPMQGDVERSDSETEPVGGLSGIPVNLFDEYDYVALGHIHGPQSIGRDCVRYSGSPLKYSFSEAAHKKAITVVDLAEKGECAIANLPLIPLRDMRKISEPFEALTSKEVMLEQNPNDYLHITLTDEEEIVDAIGKLRRFYPNVMELTFDNSRTRHEANLSAIVAIEKKTPLELFQSFYKEQNGVDLTEAQTSIVADLFKNMESSL